MNKIFKIITLFSLLFVGLSTAYATEGIDEASQLWETGNESYIKGDYADAIVDYDAALAKGYDGVKLYFNLGNAYYKEGNIGKAIVNYKRALRLDPRDKDVVHNLEIAKLQTKNIIEAVPEFILVTWFKNLRSLFSSNQWSRVSIISFVFIFAAVLCFLLSLKASVRKSFFSLSILFLFVFFLSTLFAVQQRANIVDSSSAVVLSGAAVVKSSPDNNGKDIFIINEGAFVDVTDIVGEWSKVTIESGNEGWIKSTAIEII